MNILLVHPSSKDVYKNFKRKPIYRLPIGLAYIAAMAERENHAVEVIDAEAEDLSTQELAERLKNSQADVLGVTCTTPLFPVACGILQLAKELLPDVKTIIGGQHVSALPEESLSQAIAADFIIFGEGDITFAELIAALENDQPLENIQGIGFRKNEEIIINAPRPLVTNLDDLPFPARNKFPLLKYRDPDRYDEPYTLFVTSRGCPYNCIFCGSSAIWGRKVRFRSAENVLSEIDDVVNQYHIKRITFCDDTFTVQKERVLQICQGIIDHNYGITFCASSRVNTIDEQMLEMLAKAGCQELSFGVESGDENILKIIRKDIRLEQVMPVFTLVKKYGIRVHSSYIIGNPTDTHRTIQKTLDFALQSGTDAAQFSIATPYPGTPMWQMAVESNKLQTKDFSQFKWYYSVVANLSEVSNEDLIRYQKEAYRRFNEISK